MEVSMRVVEWCENAIQVIWIVIYEIAITIMCPKTSTRREW